MGSNSRARSGRHPATTSAAAGTRPWDRRVGAPRANSATTRVARARAPASNPMALFYNYAVVDPKYPGEPHYWGLEGFGFGDAAVLGWTFEFAPNATKT